MASITHFVALPYLRTDLVAGEGRERPTANQAVRAAESLSRTNAGAVAFSRTGDPAIGDVKDAVVLASFGEVPNLDLLSAT